MHAHTVTHARTHTHTCVCHMHAHTHNTQAHVHSHTCTQKHTREYKEQHITSCRGMPTQGHAMKAHAIGSTTQHITKVTGEGASYKSQLG